MLTLNFFETEEVSVQHFESSNKNVKFPKSQPMQISVVYTRRIRENVIITIEVYFEFVEE